MNDEYVSIPLILDRVAGLQQGDTLLVSSDVLGLAAEARSHGENFNPHQMIDRLLEKIGPVGTLMFPTHHYGFCKGLRYDIRNTPSMTGTLSRAALARPEFKRTQHPIHSFAVAGRYRDEICRINHRSSFGIDSPFGFLHRHRGKMLMIGLSYRHCFAFVHFVEEQEKAHYRYLKDFSGEYVREDEKVEIRTYSMYVRDLERGVESFSDPIGKILEEANISRVSVVNHVSFRLIRLANAYTVIAEDIKNNGGKKLHRVGTALKQFDIQQSVYPFDVVS